MAKITEIVKSISAKINLGNYQSADYFVSLKAEVNGSPGDIDAAIAGLTIRCNEILLNDLRAHFKARGKKITDSAIRRQFGIADAEFE